MTEAMTQGVISEEWTKGITVLNQNHGLWAEVSYYNPRYRIHKPHLSGTYEDVAEFEFGELANIVTWFSSTKYTPRQIAHFAKKRQPYVLNLAFEEPGRLTSTRFLLAGVLAHPEKETPDTRSPEIYKTLGKFVNHGDETWVIPESAVNTAGPSHVTAEVVLPHQVI